MWQMRINECGAGLHYPPVWCHTCFIPQRLSVTLSASLPAVHSSNVHFSAMCKSTVHSRTFVHVLISALHWYHLTLVFAIRYCSVQSLFVEFDSLRPSLYFQASAEPGDMNYDDWCFLSPPKITSFPRSPPTIKLITLTRSWTGAGFEPGCQKSVTGSPCSKCRCLGQDWRNWPVTKFTDTFHPLQFTHSRTP